MKKPSEFVMISKGTSIMKKKLLKVANVLRNKRVYFVVWVQRYVNFYLENSLYPNLKELKSNDFSK